MNTPHRAGRSQGPERWRGLSHAALSGSAAAWLAVTLAGQVVFAAYRRGAAARLGTAVVIGVVTLATGVGTFAATAGLWLPRMSL